MSNSGLIKENISTEIRPQDDLYRHVNGAWLASAEIPSDRAADGSFYHLRDLSEERVRAIIEGADGPEGSNAAKIRDLYRDFMDESAIGARGLEPIAADLSQALAVSEKSAFIETLGLLEGRGRAALFGGYITTDKDDPTVNIAYLGQGGLSLPDEAYYRADEHRGIRDSLLGHIERIFTLAGIDRGAERAKAILALETEIATHHWDKVRNRDAVATYNKMSFDEIASLAPHFDFRLWSDASNTPAKVLAPAVIRQPSFLVTARPISIHPLSTRTSTSTAGPLVGSQS